MTNPLVVSMSALALLAGAVCHAQEPPVEEVVVSTEGLYGDWKMVLPEWPGIDHPVVGDFCDFKKHGDGVAIVCADDFLQDIPEVTLKDDKLRLRWGGALTHTIYDAVWQGNGTFAGEIIQAQIGIVEQRFKANMVRVSNQPGGDAPPASLAVLNTYFDDLTSGSIHEKYYEGDVVKAMKAAIAKGAYAHAGFSANYFGKIVEQKGNGPALLLDVFKVSNAANAEQWCMVRVDAENLADVRCRAFHTKLAGELGPLTGCRRVGQPHQDSHRRLVCVRRIPLLLLKASSRHLRWIGFE